MKGVVLAGGRGSRLYPLTRVTNKHLLPVYNQPMVFYPIQTLVAAGIEDIIVVTGGQNSGDFLRLYFYDSTVFDKIARTKPSWRNELEITDVNNMYLQEGTLTHSVLDGWWSDAGTFESLLRATNLVAKTGANKVPGRGSPPRHSKQL